jgi:CRISPR/Cas system-associated endoribonuclease Cas2
MKIRIEDLIDAAEDRVRYYTLCQACLSKVEFTGIGKSPEKEAYRVV